MSGLLPTFACDTMDPKNCCPTLDRIQAEAERLMGDVLRLRAAVDQGRTPDPDLLREIRLAAHAIQTATYPAPVRPKWKGNQSASPGQQARRMLAKQGAFTVEGVL